MTEAYSFCAHTPEGQRGLCWICDQHRRYRLALEEILSPKCQDRAGMCRSIAREALEDK